jgi:phosphoribosylglycinamide formyltransferase 2
MAVAHAVEVISMTDPEALKAVVRRHRPDLVIPEIEALAVDALVELEAEGITVIPTARATAITMNRDRIRDLAAAELGLRTARAMPTPTAPQAWPPPLPPWAGPWSSSR